MSGVLVYQITWTPLGEGKARGRGVRDPPHPSSSCEPGPQEGHLPQVDTSPFLHRFLSRGTGHAILPGLGRHSEYEITILAYYRDGARSDPVSSLRYTLVGDPACPRTPQSVGLTGSPYSPDPASGQLGPSRAQAKPSRQDPCGQGSRSLGVTPHSKVVPQLASVALSGPGHWAAGGHGGAGVGEWRAWQSGGEALPSEVPYASCSPQSAVAHPPT